MRHNFKTHKDPFIALWLGTKKADLRDLSDRREKPEICDIVFFSEIDSSGVETGRMLECVITHIQTGYVLGPNQVSMSVEIIKRHDFSRSTDQHLHGSNDNQEGK